jgi:hypothetical protein
MPPLTDLWPQNDCSLWSLNLPSDHARPSSAGLAVQARRVEEDWVTLAVRRASDLEQGSSHV